MHITLDEDHAEVCAVFNVPIPGWLPATAAFGDDKTPQPSGIAYALHATAKFHEVEDASSSRLLGNIRSAVKPSQKSKAVVAEKVPICVTRYITPPARGYDEEGSAGGIPVHTLSIDSLPDPRFSKVPEAVFRSLKMVAVVPQFVSAKDETVTVGIRMKCEDAHMRKRVRILGFTGDVVQMEKYRSVLPLPSPTRYLHFSSSHTPLPNYTATFPIPPPSQQPPNRPLKSPHPANTLRDMGLMRLSSTARPEVRREYNLTPPESTRIFRPNGQEGIPLHEYNIRMDIEIPVAKVMFDNRGKNIRKMSGAGPQLAVKHEVRVNVEVGYEGSRMKASDSVEVVLPIEFVNIASPPPSASSYYSHHPHIPRSMPIQRQQPARPASRTPSLSSSGGSSSSHFSAPHTPYRDPAPRPLPAYSQLYYENGDRRDELMGTLPVYKEDEDPARVLMRGGPGRPSYGTRAPSRTGYDTETQAAAGGRRYSTQRSSRY